ncbi:MAG: hypothetical protein EXR71_17625 [Myxococcales bacterium]|nr:hypothetical protein [Myxococcales bacterium]
MIALFLACSNDPAWVVQRASIVPTSTGMEGTQTWEFYAAGWSPDAGDEGSLCTRGQTLVGALTTAPACPDCRAAYDLAVTELDSDCADALIRDPGFSGPALYAIGEVPADLLAEEPFPGEGFGWSEGFGDGSLIDVGYAYAEALDLGEVPPAGLATGATYTLLPAIAWEL